MAFKNVPNIIIENARIRVLAIIKQGKCPKLKGNSPLFS